MCYLQLMAYIGNTLTSITHLEIMHPISSLKANVPIPNWSCSCEVRYWDNWLLNELLVHLCYRSLNTFYELTSTEYWFEIPYSIRYW